MKRFILIGLLISLSLGIVFLITGLSWYFFKRSSSSLEELSNKTALRSDSINENFEESQNFYLRNPLFQEKTENSEINSGNKEDNNKEESANLLKPLTDSTETITQKSLELAPNKAVSKNSQLGPSLDYELTEKEIFEYLYPAYYRDYLSYLQDRLINIGFIKKDERFLMQSDEEIASFIIRGLDYLNSINSISLTQKEQFIRSVREWIKLQKQEAEALKRSQQSGYKSLYSSLSVFDRIQLYVFNPKKNRSIIDNFLTKVFASDCYRDEGPNSTRGSNLWARCCDCEECADKECVPVGCLNAVCTSGNAIWDPVTHICGCDG